MQQSVGCGLAIDSLEETEELKAQNVVSPDI
jgi:hypothetical protein